MEEQALLLTTEPSVAQSLLLLHLPRSSWFRIVRRAACLWGRSVGSSEGQFSSLPHQLQAGHRHHSPSEQFIVLKTYPGNKISVRLAAGRGSMQCTMCRNKMVQVLCVIIIFPNSFILSSPCWFFGFVFLFLHLTVVSLDSLSICGRGQAQALCSSSSLPSRHLNTK